MFGNYECGTHSKYQSFEFSLSVSQKHTQNFTSNFFSGQSRELELSIDILITYECSLGLVTKGAQKKLSKMYKNPTLSAVLNFASLHHDYKVNLAWKNHKNFNFQKVKKWSENCRKHLWECNKHLKNVLGTSEVIWPDHNMSKKFLKIVQNW